MSAGERVFVTPAELEGVRERLEARALRAEQAILRLEDRLEAVDARVTARLDYVAAVDAVARRLVDLEGDVCALERGPMMPGKHELGPGITGYSGGTPSRDEVIELVTRNARAAGCTCELEVRLPDNYGVRGEVARVEVVHDPACPIVNPSPSP